MERIKRRKLKFPCLFGGNEKTPKRRMVQSWFPGNATTTNHGLFKFQVGKNTSKRSNEKPVKKLLAKLMGRDGASCVRHINKQQRRLFHNSSKITMEQHFTNVVYQDLEASHVPNHHHPLQSTAKTKLKIKESMTTIHGNHDEVLRGSNNSDLMLNFLQQPDSSFLKHLHDHQQPDSIRETSAYHDLIPPRKIVVNTRDAKNLDQSYDDYTKTMPLSVTFDRNDRITHSLSSISISEPSLILEAKNKMSEKRKMDHCHEDLGTVNKDCILGEILSVKQMELNTSPSRSTSFQHQSHRMSVCHKAEADAIFEVDDGYKIEMSFGVEKKCSKSYSQEPMITEESGGPSTFQSSGLASEISELDYGNQLSVQEDSSTQEVLSRSDRLERLNAQLRDLKKQLHLLTLESLYISNPPTLTRKRDHHNQQPSQPATWQSSLSSHILQTSHIYETDSDTIHHPTDPRLFYRIEKHYFQGEILSKTEKHLIYDYIEQTFIRVSKSMAGCQLTLSKLSIEDQVVKVVEEIDKDEDEISHANNYDKDVVWGEHANQIDSLGNLLSELVLNDLVLEVIS